MSTRSEERQKEQIKILNSGCEISVGNINNLPISIADIKKIDKNSFAGENYTVEKYFGGGLTAEVYKIKADGRFWNLKKKRDKILVSNIDGQTSFLNEVQRRQDFENLKIKKKYEYRGIVDTIYASFKEGFIFSPWIEGEEIAFYNEEILKNIFETLFNMVIEGIFEYDLCSGNIIVEEDNNVKLFDFGYAYTYNPLTEFNPDGRDLPQFHPVERLESRNLMQHLMDMDNFLGTNQMLKLYRTEKSLAINFYEKFIGWLEKKNADNDILNWLKKIISLWEYGLHNEQSLTELYRLESFRSYILDIHDDLSGKSCTPDSMTKI